jgi:hypothetical protein
MAQILTQNNPTGIAGFAQGSITGTYTAADVTLTLGFKPRYFKVINVTDRLTQEWYAGMNVGDFLETAAAGTQTLETDDKLVVNSDGTVTLVAAGGIITDNDTVVWVAHG